MKTCFKCGKNEEEATIISHHISYFPEKIVDCCRSCHIKIHKRIRRNNLCRIPKDMVDILSSRSSAKRNYKNIKRLNFEESLISNVRIRETLYHNNKTNEISYTCGFEATHGKELFYIGD